MRADANPYQIPDDLPVPTDDGACDHVVGQAVPSISLRSTRGGRIHVAEAARRLAVFYFYPGTIRPGIPIPAEWSAIPGVRGCTLQNADYRDAYPDFEKMGCRVFGVSGQGEDDPERGLAEQVELSQRLRLPFELLNDSRFEFVRALGLPTFEVRLRSPVFEYEGKPATFVLQGKTLVKRLTIVASRGRVEKVFYPVFPPHRSAATALEYLRSRPREPAGPER
jgi:peroxiredoxin